MVYHAEYRGGAIPRGTSAAARQQGGIVGMAEIYVAERCNRGVICATLYLHDFPR